MDDEEPNTQSVPDFGMTDTNDQEEDHLSFTEIDIEKEELDFCNEEDCLDSLGVGPIRIQEVSKFTGLRMIHLSSHFTNVYMSLLSYLERFLKFSFSIRV